MNDPNILTSATVQDNWQSQMPEGVTLSGELGSEPSLTFAEGAVAPTEITTVIVAKGTGSEVTSEDMAYYHAYGGAFGGTSMESTWNNSSYGIQRSSAGNQYFTGQTVGTRMVIFFPATEATSSQSAAAAEVLVLDVVGAINANS